MKPPKALQLIIELVSALAIGVTLPASASGTGVLYPESALENGIEGWVEVRFWVDHACEFKAEVLSAEPEGVFDDVAVARLESMHVRDEEDVDWSKVGFEPSLGADGEAMSAAEYESLRAEVDSAGPWPRKRTIVGFPNGEVLCRFGLDGTLLSIDVGTRTVEDFRNEQADSHLPFVEKQVLRMRFEIDR